MNFKIKNIFTSGNLFLGICLIVLAIGVMLRYLPPELVWVVYMAIGAVLLLLVLLWRSVLKPAQTVVRGMELIKAQDFNNRLLPVNEVESDKIVSMFNQMIDRLRNERLYNREQDGFLKLLIEASPMGVVVLDYDNRVEMANDSFLKITGIAKPEDAVGMTVADLPSGLARKMAEVALGCNEIIRFGDVKRYRCYHLSFLRTGFHIHFYLLESLTEEVMMAERAAYEKVIRIISHEVNNTMGGVRSVLETIHDLSEEDDLREVIDSCDNRCARMCNFISSYADVVRVPEPVMVAVELNAEIKKMTPFLQEIAGEMVELRYKPFGSAIRVNMDLTLMQQVIVNIVKNAKESIVGNGFIDIETRNEQGKAAVVISNNGMPISEEVSRNLFSPFFTTKREGRGLGLTLISEILNRHQAQYSLMTGDDGITRFHIQFC